MKLTKEDIGKLAGRLFLLSTVGITLALVGSLVYSCISEAADAKGISCSGGTYSQTTVYGGVSTERYELKSK